MTRRARNELTVLEYDYDSKSFGSSSSSEESDRDMIDHVLDEALAAGMYYYYYSY